MSALILIVDDEPRMIDMIGIALESQGLSWLGAHSASEAYDAVLNHPVDLVVLDIMMPGQSGLEFCRRVRETSALPIILVTALGSTHERIAGLEAGADDYITKPFSPRELALRVQAVLRRERGAPQAEPAEALRRQVGDLVLDAGSLGVHIAGRRVRVSPGEFKMLWLLSERPGQTYGWRELFAAMGADGLPFGGREAVRTAVYRLRTKLGDSPQAPRHLLTDRGRGYRLVAVQTSQHCDDPEPSS